MPHSVRSNDENHAILHPPRHRRRAGLPIMRDDYLQEARKKVDDPYVLVNVVSQRVKQLKRGSRPLVESLEKLAPEDIALREIIEGKISFEQVFVEPPVPPRRRLAPWASAA